MNSILVQLREVKQRITNAAKKAGRNPEEVRLLLATKTVDAERIKLVLNAGETLIGENKVQELKEKYLDLQDISHETHFIGHLQTNKIKEVLKYVNCIQTVDRLDLVQKLDRRLQSEGRKIDILMQVNTSYEESKFGVSADQALTLIQEIAKYDTLQVKGLMTIGLFSTEAEKVRKCFQMLKKIRTEIQSLDLKNVDMKELSMGMSNDLEIAIEQGATIIRVGTAIFGTRQYPDSYYWNEKQGI